MYMLVVFYSGFDKGQVHPPALKCSSRAAGGKATHVYQAIHCAVPQSVCFTDNPEAAFK